MLGQDVRRVAAERAHEVLAAARTDLDVTDPAAVDRLIAGFRPEAVINCAAYTRVDDAEREIDAAVAGNTLGPALLANACARLGAWLIHVSTDYVFDGAATDPYTESAPPAPRSVYGWTKLAGESQIRALLPQRHAIVRTSWLFGPGGPCFPATILRLAAERDELKVVGDQRGCPTFTPHLAQALVDLAQARALSGVVHVAGGGECSWYEFAAAIVTGAGLSATVRPCTTAEFPRPAPRPAFSVLRSERGAPVLPDWRTGLREYLAVRASTAAPAPVSTAAPAPDSARVPA